MRRVIISGGFFVLMTQLLTPLLVAQVSAEHYRVETVHTPEGIAPEVSAITFTDKGELVVCLRRGYIHVRDSTTLQWKRFAFGLLNPLGILPGKAGEFFVCQVPELTRIADTDGDGFADLYETICDEWGLSGNYHEFAYGLVRDKQGNFYVGLGSASKNAKIRPPFRGELIKRGYMAKEPKEGTVYRVNHFSPVAYRGWVIKITPSGKLIPLACGFRQPNGLCLSAQGDLFAVDNQGEWIGTSPLHHITPGAFYGHPSSLNWHPDFKDRDPLEVPVETLAKRRKMPAIQFPQHDMAGSIASPLFDTTEGKFGPYTGQLFVAEWVHPRILRADLEKVAGEYQGACFIFIEGNGLRTGNNRLAFAPDGSLYVAQTSRIWGPSEGLQRIRWAGRTPMDILKMRLTRTGFELTFTKPVDPGSAKDPSVYSINHYYYKYHSEYGSPKTDVAPVKVTDVSISSDGRRVRLTLEQLIAGRVYELRPGPIRSAQGDPLVTKIAAYTLNRLK
ncbi:hypothetical protein MYX84_03415 [Acidobacteria bacterium AH-259-O06]|nr:hypothetical protein [Acidobacteria bacterium AH-259-O06]